VLLIEPDADDRELYLLGLAAAGFDVVAAAAATAAAVAFAAATPAIVVTATRITGHCAIALLRRFSEASVPVIAFTTAPSSQHDAFWRHVRALEAVSSRPARGRDRLGTR
jgi:DNA-binding response OmpR family regulator